MLVSWLLFRRILMSTALLGALIANPARARVTGNHLAGSEHGRKIVIRNHAHAGALHRPLRHHRPMVRRKPPGAHPAIRNTNPPHLRRQMAHHDSAKPNTHRATANKRPLVVIDPGHGGRDPGAVGLSGTLEKDVTLAAALDLKRLLEATGRYRVAMTRASDIFVSLAGRVAFARSHKASLVIAIHANASENKWAAPC